MVLVTHRRSLENFGQRDLLLVSCLDCIRQPSSRFDLSRLGPTETHGPSGERRQKKKMARATNGLLTHCSSALSSVGSTDLVEPVTIQSSTYQESASRRSSSNAAVALPPRNSKAKAGDPSSSSLGFWCIFITRRLPKVLHSFPSFLIVRN